MLEVLPNTKNYIVKENNNQDGPKRLVLILIMQIIC